LSTVLVALQHDSTINKMATLATQANLGAFLYSTTN